MLPFSISITYSPVTTSGRNTIAIASAIAPLAYISMSLYELNVYNIEHAAETNKECLNPSSLTTRLTQIKLTAAVARLVQKNIRYTQNLREYPIPLNIAKGYKNNSG